MAGFTPFQFSSNKLQYERAFSLSDNDGLAGSTVSALLAWYDMWINPESITVSNSYIQNPSHTANGIVTYHYRKDLGKVSCNGSIGWVAIKSLIEEARDGTIGDLVNIQKNVAKIGANFTKATSNFSINNPAAVTGKTSNINNSPRIFLDRIRSMANEPMYYMDSSGVEHYNQKYIKIFTKQFPDGLILEGYFTEFSVPETAQDKQTVKYNFNFTVENYRPITITERIVGMYSDYGSVIGDISSIVTGFGVI